MKIDNLLNPLPGGSIRGSANRSSTAVEKNAAARAPSAPQDSVQLSGLSPSAETAGAPIDTKRVEAIKQAISEGRFKINHEAIANGLIATAKGLMVGHNA
ncbi:MAG: flagellar biosynthesis anti-sigma factor FlgM [Sulfuricellaceae bacterium]